MYRVLVIDDEEVVVELIGKTLAKFGYNVETAKGGQEGLRIFEKRLFDLVITDIRMPDVDGFGVARHIRNSERPYTPIIGISATSHFEEEKAFDSFLLKPFEIQALLRMVKDLTSNNSSAHDKAMHKRTIMH
jgi:CheY-like chemotaxis protein